MLAEGIEHQAHPFVVDMFIHTPSKDPSQRNNKHPTKTFRRVLLDTGADFNLISYHAQTELSLDRKPYRGFVHSISGHTELSSTTLLQWHFRGSGKKEALSTLHCDQFYVLSAEVSPNFDCILGRHWIARNWAEFLDLISIKS